MKEHIKFVRNKEKGNDWGDTVFDIINKSGDELGDIYYSKEWKTWIFEAGIGAYFDIKCLSQVMAFLQELNVRNKH